MIATLVIGLREGLEASLIVGIIAAFLKRNGRSLTAMWIGVIAAVLLSIAVGSVLWVLESALPQSAQEALETVVGVIAVVFVTGMLVWMNSHTRTMKGTLETEAAAALQDGRALALAAMAFLAVLKEGFETSVFLLATFRASSSSWFGAAGAAIGIAIAIAIGYGIYAGGVRINLARFFKVTGAFLILVAAGLVLTAVRTAHEAGWIAAGQERTVDLSWLAPLGSVQGAVVTGVLGIPVDPRVIEVVAWFAYLVPVVAVVYWPRSVRPIGTAAVRLRIGVAATLTGAAVVLAVASALQPRIDTGAVPLSGGGTVRLAGDTLIAQRAGRVERAALPAGVPDTVAGASVLRRTQVGSTTVAGPARVTLDQLLAFGSGRLPVGIDPARNPGPFSASWQAAVTTTAWTSGGAVIDATRAARTLLTVSGGGLTSPRTIAVQGTGAPAADSWRIPTARSHRAADTVAAAVADGPARMLWGVQVPIILILGAIALAISARRARSRLGPTPDHRPTSPTMRSTTVAARP